MFKEKPNQSFLNIETVVNLDQVSNIQTYHINLEDKIEDAAYFFNKLGNFSDTQYNKISSFINQVNSVINENKYVSQIKVIVGREGGGLVIYFYYSSSFYFLNENEVENIYKKILSLAKYCSATEKAIVPSGPFSNIVLDKKAVRFW